MQTLPSYHQHVAHHHPESRVIPTIVCHHHQDDDGGIQVLVPCERAQILRTRQRRLARTRVRRNSSRRINSAPKDDDGSSSSSSSSRNSSPRRAVRNKPGETTTGYKQYLELLQVPKSHFGGQGALEWGEPSGDDLSSDWSDQWDSDQSFKSEETIGCSVLESKVQKNNVKSSGWRKLRNIVQLTPFFQTSYKKQRYPWVQLAGHQGNFRAGTTPGTILKKLSDTEVDCFEQLMKDVLRPYVPEFKGILTVREPAEDRGQTKIYGSPKPQSPQDVDRINEDEKNTVESSYLQLQDLLGEFDKPCVMDCKVGVRTYLESELAKAKERPKLRRDMYEKMIQVDPEAPSAKERLDEAVTKPRYMVWRETISSTATLGFRVEGMKLANGLTSKEFKTTRSREQVIEAFKTFIKGYTHAVPKYLQRLKAIRATLKSSNFFATHEVVGSSLLFVHDATNAGIWMIDFAKTLPLPNHLPRIKHDAEWQVGNHEDGYLIGINNLIDIFQEIMDSHLATMETATD